MAVHELVKGMLLPDNYPPYRYYEECSCGFQTRMPSKDLADSQFRSHLVTVGAETSTRMLTKAELIAKSPDVPKPETKPTWSPFGGKPLIGKK